MRFGNITPTDIDGLIEYKDKCYILFETKLGDAKMPYGQELALTRLVDNLNKPAVLFETTHNVDDVNQDIDIGQSIVKRYYWHKTWFYLDKEHTLENATRQFIKKIESENTGIDLC